MAPAPAVPATLESLIGQTVAERYEVTSCVGIGGMAVVFAGQHRSLEQRVAIKVLRPEYQDKGVLVARFRREARIASGLEHPHVINVFDFGTTADGFQFMVMPFLDGVELSRALFKPLVPSQVVALSLQVLNGLDHVHGRGFVHRDVKPENIFIVRNHQHREIVKLVDFGVAKSTDDARGNEAVLTRTGLVVGTPTHMAPEQVMGLDVDARTDLYALGVTMYEMLTGLLPFVDDDANRLLRRHVKDPPPPLPQSVPDDIRVVVGKLLAKKPEHRFPSAAAVARDLAAVEQRLSKDVTPWRPILADFDPGGPVRPQTASGSTVAWQAKDTATRINAALEQIIEGRRTTSDLLTDLLGFQDDGDA